MRGQKTGAILRTSLTRDESHPDRYSAQYRAESQPDGIIGIGTWRRLHCLLWFIDD